MKRKRWGWSGLKVYWCFFHTRREWSDEACSEVVRWSLPDGTPLLAAVLNLRTATCRQCERSFRHSSQGRRPYWCSDACRMQARRRAA